MAELFRRAAAGENAARDHLVAANLNLVRHVVRRFGAVGYDADDLFQVGCLGLIKAVNRFNPSLGYRFSTYAVPLILGEIQRYLRDVAAPGLGRGALRLAQAARRTEEQLAMRWHRRPTIVEIAAELGIPPAELVGALEAARRPASLEEGDPRRAGDLPLLSRLAAGDTETGDRLALRTLLASLPARERQVLVLRYYLDRSQAEVGAVLGLSQPQVSRLEKRALATLRRLWMAGEGERTSRG